MSTRTAYRTLDEVEIASRPDVTSIEVTLSYYWENDGIGPYEYWGSVGFDRGHDYVTIEDYSYDKTGMTAEEIKTIDSMIETMLDRMWRYFHRSLPIWRGLTKTRWTCWSRFTLKCFHPLQ